MSDDVVREIHTLIVTRGTPTEVEAVRAFLSGNSAIYVTSTLSLVDNVIRRVTRLPVEQRHRLLALLMEDDDDGPSGVREPRVPRPPYAGGAAAVAEIEEEVVEVRP